MAWIDYKKTYDMVLQRWTQHCLKMYKITDQVVQFIEKTIQIWRVELILLFVIAMMALNHILRKCTASYKLIKSQKKSHHLMYMDDIKIFAKNEKELETLILTVRMYSQNIGMEFGIEKWIMLE